MGHSVAFSPDGHVLAVGCTNGEIDLWPLDSPGTMKPYVLKKHQDLVWTIAFSPDGNTMASGSADHNVVIWDVPTAEDLMTLKHNGTIETLKFSTDGRLLATASHEPSRGSVCLWRAPADEEAPQNSLRPVSGPTVLNGPGGSSRPISLDSATAQRPGYTDPVTPPARAATSWSGQTSQSVQQPAGFDRRALDAAAQQPSNYLPTDGDRYSGQAAGNLNSGAPSAIAPMPTATSYDATTAPPYNGGPTDPSVPLPTATGGLTAAGSAASGPQLNGLTPPGGFSAPGNAQPGGTQGDPSSGGRPNGGRRNRPVNTGNQ
jgi:WD40 repeat protein